MWLLWIALGTWTLWSGCSAQSHRHPSPSVDTSAAPAVQLPQFDAANAYRLIEQQVAFGPRVPGLPGHDSCRVFLRSYLAQYADTVFEQRFTQRVYGKTLHLTNIGASFRSELRSRVLLCAHWDTRPYADEDPIPENRQKPIPGANDGGSGVAVLLELARLMAQTPPPVGVDILLVDGEDYGQASDLEHFCLGSRYAAQNYPFPVPPRWVVVLDLVGDREAWFPWERYSWENAPELVRALWDIGARRAPAVFRNELGPAIFDDHVPFIESGYRAVVVIDAELVGNRSPHPRRRYWHTLQDTPANISQATLATVGQVVVEWLYTVPW